MNTENTVRTRHRTTDADRENIMKLVERGLTANEVAEIMHISTSSVNHVRQAHRAAVTRDWSALQKLSTEIRQTVEWAMKVTGADKEFKETFGSPDEPEQTVASPTVDNTPAPDPITREDFLKLCNTMQDICYLLTEVRDMLK